MSQLAPESWSPCEAGRRVVRHTPMEAFGYYAGPVR
jgi:hypothetical protein